MITIIAFSVLSLVLIFSMFIIYKLLNREGYDYSEIVKLEKKINSLQKELLQKEEEFEMFKKRKQEDKTLSLIGCEALYTKSLTYNQGKKDEEFFEVTYEVEILEVSSDKAKIKIIDFTTSSNIGKEPSIRNKIIDLHDETWAPINELSVVKDDRYIRNHKLEKLGIS